MIILFLIEQDALTQMKRCSAPCVQRINKVDYFEDITSANLLTSSDTKTVERLSKEIETAVSNFNLKSCRNKRSS